ncbi:MAG: RluA family pseudouridine synthase [Aureliella sp.]
MESVPIDILLEESSFWTINKPAGIQSQAVQGVPCVQRLLSEQIADRDGHAGKPFVGLPHRLDRVTSGVMLIARNQRSLKQFNAQFQSRKVQKYYLAILETESTAIAETEIWIDQIRKIPDIAKAELVPPNSKTEETGAKQAELAIAVLASSESMRLALIQLRTGRMHQIRLQSASREMPVLGDQLYGAKESFGEEEPTHREAPIALHSLRLEFRHPKTGVPVASTAPVPPRWADLPTDLIERVNAITQQSMTEVSSTWDSMFPAADRREDQ